MEFGGLRAMDDILQAPLNPATKFLRLSMVCILQAIVFQNFQINALTVRIQELNNVNLRL